MVHVAAWRNRPLCVTLATYFLWLLLPAFSSPVQRRHGFLSIVVALRPCEAKAEEPFNPLKLKGYFWETGKFYEGETSEANIAEILEELKETESLLRLETALRILLLFDDMMWFAWSLQNSKSIWFAPVLCCWLNRIEPRQPFESLVSEGKFEELKTKLRGANFSESLLRIRGKRVLWSAFWIWTFFSGAKIWKLLFEDTVVAICFFFISNCSVFLPCLCRVNTHI